jgi:threonine/homoserine/homoserine lactone efflux protein
MSIELLVALAAFAFVSSITPGPNNMMVLASAVNHGFRRTIPHLFGIGIGFAFMLLLVGFGIGQIFVAWPWTNDVLKLVSIGYMLWLAWHIATAQPIDANSDQRPQRPLTFFEAAAFQWVNPKAWSLCLTAIAAYTVPTDMRISLLLAALVFTVVNIPTVSIWALFGVTLRNVLADPRRVRIFNITMALALVTSLWPSIAEYVR